MDGQKTEKTERVDDQAIILDINGVYPRKLIVVDRKKQVAEYRLVRTKTGGFCLNK